MVFSATFSISRSRPWSAEAARPVSIIGLRDFQVQRLFFRFIGNRLLDDGFFYCCIRRRLFHLLIGDRRFFRRNGAAGGQQENQNNRVHQPGVKLRRSGLYDAGDRRTEVVTPRLIHGKFS
jgi:hypothetical protein